MHKLKRLFKRKRPSPVKNEDSHAQAKKAKRNELNITIIEQPTKKKKNHKIQRFLQKLISRSNYDHAQLSAYRKANESIRTSHSHRRQNNGDHSTTEISIIGDETIGEKSLFEENRIEFITSIKPKKYTPKQSRAELQSRQLLERVKEQRDETRVTFIDENERLLQWTRNSAAHYGYRKRAGMARCARDTRDAELSESFVELKDRHLSEAIADPIGLLKCDINIKTTLPQFTDEHRDYIDKMLQQTLPPNAVIAEIDRNQCTLADLRTLDGLNWLNDEVINYYLQLIHIRSKTTTYPSVHCFNTFLYPKLKDKGFNTVKRWTRKVNIFEHDLIMFPIHLGMHWCLAYADTRKKVVRYLDSLGDDNDLCVEVLLDYLRDEHKAKYQKALPAGWATESISRHVPHQFNSSDCGMFALKFADFISRDLSLSFSQDDMPLFRRLMKYEILSNQLVC